MLNAFSQIAKVWKGIKKRKTSLKLAVKVSRERKLEKYENEYYYLLW